MVMEIIAALLAAVIFVYMPNEHRWGNAKAGVITAATFCCAFALILLGWL